MLVIATALVVLYAFVTTRTGIGRQTNVGGKPPLRPPEGSRRQGGISRVTCCLLLNIARAF
jgi:ABC-type xylose transport system permease subunit